jgi:bifunctional DNase/RNase
MTVLGVSPDAAGNALFLTDDARTTVVPVMIGDAEAMVIELRLRHEGFERPLTHDLLDRAIEALGGTVVMVQVNKLRADVFVGTVLLWDGHEMHRLDARTSDAVAVALGHDVPIYVHEVVIAETGMPTSELGGAAPP